MEDSKENFSLDLGSERVNRKGKKRRKKGKKKGKKKRTKKGKKKIISAYAKLFWSD